ncbi:hypothetical protein L593_08035 [Salinarchaeum sp. Harcht-Bsk1]|uniref:beta strand repeat-containing protein n=1 Tax=Salinarchaeum sp. Harcht-Bsk1 TaxID=1333523 RepID=UPI0003423DC6|nr:PKD domain-containing protein [Salinarchaeum sp. Harcht-Bsk1]AGN01552.1 hypothetical protein L593_08035 [Salinarchaeum sp. Harcht-Bsk1]
MTSDLRRPGSDGSEGRRSRRDRNLASTIGALVAISVVALCLAAVPVAVTADSHANGSDPYVIEQGDQCVDVDPITNTSQTVVDFYDYRSPDTTPNATTYSSYGTTAYQADNTSVLMLYRGSEGTSLVIVHEKLHEPDTEGTNGSSATFNVTGISNDGDGWAVEDDNYDAQDDQFDHYPTYSEIDWVWSRGRTDGGAYRGLDGDVEIGIDPAFNESADLRYDDEYAGYVHDWQVITATEDGFERVSLDSLTQEVTVQDGYCAPPPNASLAVSNATPEAGLTSVPLDASDSNSSTGITEYRWDLTGNGSADEVTSDATLEHTFASAGERDVAVTVVAGDGQTDTAAVAVNVTDSTAPTAEIDAPLAAVVDEQLAISGNDSSDNDRIASYAWTFGDGTSATGATVEHSYASTGVYNLTLTVTDPSDHEATANQTVTVSQAPPNASLSAPGQATLNETVLLDASGTDAGPNATYEWVIDGTTANVTNASTYETAFAARGTHDVSVAVTDDGGFDSASATIDVYRPLNASLDATPLNVTAGEPVAFDANASTGNVTRYEWAFGDGATIADGNATVEHEYAAAGEYTAEVTAVGATGATDSTTVTVDVTPAPGPTAQLSAPGEVAVNETATLDASGSEAGPNATYEWSVDGEVLHTTSEPTYQTSFTTAGDHEVVVTVTDAGSTDDANATVSVVNESDGGDDSSGGGGDDSDDGGGGGGGGYGPPPVDPPEPEEPLETSVAVENGTIVVIAEHVDAGEAFVVDVPTNLTTGTNATGGATGSPNATGGANDSSDAAGGVNGSSPNASATAGDLDAVTLRSVEITPTSDAETLRVSFTRADRAVPGRFVRTPAFLSNASVSLASIRYEVGVDRTTMSAAGVSADDLTVYADDDGWTSVETNTSVAGPDIVVSTTVDGTTPLGVGAVGPVLYVSDVRTAGVVADGSFPIATTVRNTGSDRGDVSLPILVNGEPLATVTVTLTPGEQTVVESRVPIDGTRNVTVGAVGLRRTLPVVTITDFSARPAEPGLNETVTVEATLVNRGSGAGAFEAVLRRDGVVAATQTVSLAPGQRTTVTFRQMTSTAGTYRFTLGNVTETVNASRRSRFTGGGNGETQSAVPGFGALTAMTALAALLLVGILRRRRA